MKMIERASGRVIDVPDADAQAAFMTGKFGFPKGVDVPVSYPGQPTGVVSAKDAQQAFATGSRPATEPEFRKAQAEARYGGVGSAVAAGALGAARGVAETVGVPLDAAALSLASSPGQVAFEGRHEIDPYRGERTLSPVDALRERLNAYNELHPVASTVGELGGIAASTALGGGLLGKAGAVGRAVAGGIGGTAAEGAMLGDISAMNEAALGDTEATASKIMAGIGHGALIGAAGHSLFSLGAEAVAGGRDRFGRWLGTLRPKDVDALAEKTFGYAPPGLGERMQKGYAKLAAGVAGKDVDVVSKFTSLSPEGAEARRIGVFDAPKVQEAAERAVRTHVDDIMRAGDIVSAEAKGALKAEYVSKAVTRGNETAVRAFGEGQLSKIIDGAEKQLGQEMAPSMVKSVESVSKLAYRAQEAIAAGDNAAAFVELDNLKRGIQKLTSTGYRSLRAIADPVDQLNAKRTVTWLDTAAQDLRQGLEREDLWGKAAADQREINAAWTKQIDASKRFHKALTTEIGRDPTNAYLDLRGADPAKVGSYVRGLTNPNNDLTHTAVRDYVSSTEDLSKAIRRSYDLPPDASAQVERVEKAAAGFSGTIKEAERSLVLANQYRALAEGSHESVAGMASTLGFALGGLPGGVLGAAVGAVTSPGKTVAQLAALERLASKVDSKITSGVRDFLSGGARAKGRLPPPASVTMLEGKGGERATFEAKVREVQRLAGNTDELVSRVGEFTSQIDGVAPNVTRSLTLLALKATKYLADNAPPGFAQRPEAIAWGIHEAPMYSDSEMRAWSRRAAAVNDPTTVLDSLKRGIVTPEEADALRAIHTPIYDQIRGEMMAQRQAKPGAMSFGKRIQIELLYKVPLERTMDPDVRGAIQASFVPPKMPPPQRPTLSGSKERSRAAATPAQEMEMH